MTRLCGFTPPTPPGVFDHLFHAEGYNPNGRAMLLALIPDRYKSSPSSPRASSKSSPSSFRPSSRRPLHPLDAPPGG